MNIENEKIIVTGGAGFIGSHLTDRLLSLGANVNIIDNLSYGKKENINDNANFLKLDINNYKRLKTCIHKINPKIIYHLAAIATTKKSSMGWNNIILDNKVNTLGTLNILRSIVSLDVKPKIIFTSSAAVYGNPNYTPVDEEHATNPISPYGISKLSSEKYVLAYQKEYEIESTILRIFNSYGSRQSRYVMYDILNKLNKNSDELEVLGTGNQVRDYCFIDDTVKALCLALSNKSNGETYNVGSGNTFNIRQIVNMIIEIKGLRNQRIIKYTGKSWKGDINILHADISKINADLGFEPTINMEQGLKSLINWFDEKTNG